jgi:dihydroneopterin aldolase
VNARPDLWALKIGGSVDEEPGALSRLLDVIAQLASKTRIAVVPGGGAFADFVRDRCAKRFTRDDTAHIQAVISMAQYGYEIVESLAGSQPAHDIGEVDGVFERGRIPVFIPYPWILGADDIPASWSVTSDTIAVRFCGMIGAKKLVLLKSVDGIIVNGRIVAEVDASNPPVTDVVDSCFFASLKPGGETWIINGRKPERLKELVERGVAEGTRILS